MDYTPKNILGCLQQSIKCLWLAKILEKSLSGSNPVQFQHPVYIPVV